MSQKGTILVIDDEEKLRNLLKRIITLEGYTVHDASTLKAALKLLEKEPIEVVLCDVKVPDGDGVLFVRELKTRFPALEIILLTAYGNITDGVQAMKNGAFDYITKGDDNDRVIPLLAKAFEKVQLHKSIDELDKQTNQRYGFESIIGESSIILKVIELAKKVAPTDTTVLLLGETGTGKEIFAQAIHSGSQRKVKPFLALNCSAFSKELLETELFGYKAGAFTSATHDKKGLMEEAAGGTLFLDEIGEMPHELQARLLRVLETNEFIKVGDTKPTHADVRIIAATNRELEKVVTEGKFREDLYYRLNVFTISLPSLRERKQDIPLLANNFLSTFSKKTNKRIGEMSQEFTDRLLQHDWKGNIRELKNIMERAIVIADTPRLTVNNLPLELQTGMSGNQAKLNDLSLANIEKFHIKQVLLHTKNNKAEAARLLNIGLATLYRKIEEYHLQ